MFEEYNGIELNTMDRPPHSEGKGVVVGLLSVIALACIVGLIVLFV